MITSREVLIPKGMAQEIKMPVYEVPADEFNRKLALALMEIPEFKMPEWANFVKTGISKVRPPFEKDFWYKRAASILRQIYFRGVVGVGRLRTRYGSKKNRGVQPEKFKKGSGKIIRTILQQAEKAGFLEKATTGRAGRKLTSKGKEVLDSIKPDEKPKIVEKKEKVEKKQEVEKKEEVGEKEKEERKEKKQAIKEAKKKKIEEEEAQGEI